MQTENKTSIVLGIHLIDDYFYAAFYHNEMPEAIIINNPDNGNARWDIASGEETGNWADVLRTSLQNGLNRIFQLVDGSIEYITFSVPVLSESDICELLPVLESLDLQSVPFSLQEDNESFYDFVTFQNKELWANEVVLLEEKDGKLSARSLCQATFPHEKALTVKSVDFPEFDFGQEDEQTDVRFTELVEKFFEKRVVSCVFLQGETFGKNWMKSTLKLLCKNRRVFGVNDIIVKGACFRGYRKNPAEIKTKYYMGTHQLPFSVVMTVTEEGHDEVCRLVRAGTNWYDADFMWHFMVNDSDVLHFGTEPSINGVPRYIDVDISRIPHRPKFATKVEVTVHFAGLNRWYIKVSDLGLGELYPSSGIEEVVYIGEW